MEIDIDKNTLIWLITHPFLPMRPSLYVTIRIWEKIMAATGQDPEPTAKIKIINGILVHE
ncbi:MAG: hypothetical protein HQK53_12370 [Oligoflexia bacterium]|nr:hypothetical protein [Oligoflexia bacterium]